MEYISTKYSYEVFIDDTHLKIVICRLADIL